MADIGIIEINDLPAYDDLIPSVLKEMLISGERIRFYGIEDMQTAAGIVAVKEKADVAEIVYLYILPYLRGSGVMDEMLAQLFFYLYEDGFSYAQMNYIPDEYPAIANISKRFGFAEKELDFAYFDFVPEDVEKSKAAAISPRGIVRLMYLPESRREILFKAIEKNMKLYDYQFSKNSDILPYSLVYMDGDNPKGMLAVENKKQSIRRLKEGYESPGRGAYDITLFYVGTVSQLAPLALLSGLCNLLKTDLKDEEVRMTGYFPEGHVTRLIEQVLGIRGKHEVSAVLDLSRL